MTAGKGLDAQKRVYAVWAKFYDRIYQKMLARPQREAVEAACACGPDILEIGVGTGLTLPYFTPSSRVLGADLSLDMLRVAHRKVVNQRLDHVRGLMVMDACRLGFGDERFDAVTAQFVITLVPDPEQALANLAALEKSWGGTPTERMNAKYRAFVSQYGTSAPKVGDDDAVKEVMTKAENAAPQAETPANAPATTRPEEPSTDTAPQPAPSASSAPAPAAPAPTGGTAQ